MTSKAIKCLRAENKSLQSLVAKLSATIETMHLQFKRQQEDLAKYKSRAHIAPVQRPPLTVASKISATGTNDAAVCSRCPKAREVFGQLEEVVDAFAEKLDAALAEKEAQFEEKLNTALKAKDDEIGKLVAALAERDRRDEEKHQRIERQKAEERERIKQRFEDTMKEMDEMKARNKRIMELKFRKLDDDRLQHMRRRDLRHDVLQRQGTGVADAA